MKITEKQRAQLNEIPGTYDGPPPANDVEHFYVCPVCRQSVDMRRLGDVLYHDDEPHPPLPSH